MGGTLVLLVKSIKPIIKSLNITKHFKGTNKFIQTIPR